MPPNSETTTSPDPLGVRVRSADVDAWRAAGIAWLKAHPDHIQHAPRADEVIERFKQKNLLPDIPFREFLPMVFAELLHVPSPSEPGEHVATSPSPSSEAATWGKFVLILLAMIVLAVMFEGRNNPPTRSRMQQQAVENLQLQLAEPQRNRSAWAARGVNCKDDCSGHEAGYKWASRNPGITSGACRRSATSDSFREGCESWIEDSLSAENP